MRQTIGICAVVLLASAGCRFSATGEVKSSGDVDGTADATFEETEPKPAPSEPDTGLVQGKTITLKEGKLDYKGVINFEYDKAELRSDPETQKTLAEFKAFLQDHAEVSIEIEGHTDSRGSDDYNRDLSDRRAASVRAWLVENGIAESRVTSVGKGEDEPQVPEPEPCNDKVPGNSAPCEEPWAANRRVVFQVTGGAETVETAEIATAPEPPEPEPPPPAPPPEPECPWLWGGRANLLGPNSWVSIAGATQPGICWLELSLDLGLGLGDVDASEPAGGSGDGDYLSLTVPLRGRIWFMDRHSLLGDVGIGITHYRISAELTDSAGVDGDYTRNTTPIIGHLGLGYGFRPNGFQAGPRFALLIGGLFHLTDLGDSEVAPGTLANGAILQQSLDNDTDDLTDTELYGEVSFGYLW